MSTRSTHIHPALALLLTVAACTGDPHDGQERAAQAAPAASEREHGNRHAGSGSDKEGIQLSAEEAQRAGIRLATLAAHPLVDSLTVTATIRADQDRIARIAPRVEGRITRVAVGLGDVVRAGQVLATLDSQVVGEAASTWVQAQSSLRVAEADVQRAQALDAEEIIPRKDFLRSKSDHEKAAVGLRAAEDRLRLLGVAPRQGDAADPSARIDSSVAVTTPLAGRVIAKQAAPGQLATPGDALFVVADLSRLWVEADLAESVLSRVQVGAEVSVEVTAYPGERFSGRVTYVAAVLDKDKRTVAARIEVDNQDGRLKPEMFAIATIATGSAASKPAAEVLSVPDEAIVLMQGLPSVFVFAHGGYTQRAIELGDKASGRTVVKSGLAAGEQVVSAGAYALKARALKSQISDAH